MYCDKHVSNVKICILWYTLSSKSKLTHMVISGPYRVLPSASAVKSTMFIFSCFSSFYPPIQRLFNEMASKKNENIPFSKLNIFTR